MVQQIIAEISTRKFYNPLRIEIRCCQRTHGPIKWNQQHCQKTIDIRGAALPKMVHTITCTCMYIHYIYIYIHFNTCVYIHIPIQRTCMYKYITLRNTNTHTDIVDVCPFSDGPFGPGASTGIGAAVAHSTLHWIQQRIQQKPQGADGCFQKTLLEHCLPHLLCPAELYLQRAVPGGIMPFFAH